MTLEKKFVLASCVTALSLWVKIIFTLYIYISMGDVDARVHIFAATALGGRGRVTRPTLRLLYTRESPDSHFPGG